MAIVHRSLPFFVVALGTLAAYPAHAILIDDFTDSSSVAVNPGPGVDFASTSDTAPLGSILGGERFLHVTYGTGTAILETNTGTAIPDSVMSYSAAGGGSDFFYLTYDAAGAGLGGGSGTDITIGGDNAFDISVNLVDALVKLQIQADDADGDSDLVFYIGDLHYIPLPTPLPGGAPVSLTVPYALFDPSIDFDKITRLTFAFNARSTATNLEIVALQTATVPIPEPTTLAGLSLMALIVLARRRKIVN